MKLKLNNNKYLKPNFLSFSLLTFLSNGLIYILQFYLNKEKVDYFLCTEIKTYSLKIFSKNLNVIYPESCDLKVYAEGVLNIFSFYSLEEFVYTDRPLFVLYIAIIYKFINLLNLSLSSIAILKISFFIGQLFLTSFISIYLFKLFSLIKIDIGKNYLFFPWFVAVSPMFKWHIFESTSMTFTFLIFLLGIFIFIDSKNLNLNLYFFGIGLLFLIHRSSFLILALFVASSFLNKTLKKQDMKSIFYFFIPIILYYGSIYSFSSFSDHQAEVYRQFIWILDYIQGRETITGGYYCQTPKLAIKCYLKDIIMLINYLAIPSSLCFFYIFLNYKKFSTPYKNLLFISILFTLIINFFWLFIGWYPPVRFSYYGYGNLTIFLSILIFLSFKKKLSKIFYFLGYSTYFIYLNHWNSPDVVEQNYLNIISIFFYFTAILNENLIENYKNIFYKFFKEKS